jgi:hypothetical protein
VLPEMNDKNADIESVVKKALGDDLLLSEILEGLKSKNETLRYNCSKVLFRISDNQGHVLYPRWQYFADFLTADNSYWKMTALSIIANLTRVDRDGNFERIFDTFFGLLDDRSVITAIYAAASSGKIVKAKPHLEVGITNRLLSIDETHHEPGRKDLIKAAVVETFDEYFEQARDRQRMVDFVKQQLASSSPKGRKAAKAFLKRWGQDS